MRREFWPPSIAGVLLLGARLMHLPRDGALLGLPALCPLKALTGCPCPGCGMTRSLVYCAHGAWREATAFHPLGPLLYGSLWCVLLGGVLLAWRKPMRADMGVLGRRLAAPLATSFFVAMMIVWILRLSRIVPFPPNF